MNPGTPYFCWLDLETSGLDPRKDLILEVAVIITDRSLNPITRIQRVIDNAEPIDEIMARSSEYVQKMHAENGLVEDIRQRGIPRGVAENDLLALVDTPPQALHLAGNSIHFDRSFLKEQMPRFFERLHYRQLDVSSFKLIFEPRFPHEKGTPHRAMSDVEASLFELKHYLSHLCDVDDPNREAFHFLPKVDPYGVLHGRVVL